MGKRARDPFARCVPATTMLRTAEQTTADADDVGSSEPSYDNPHTFDNVECVYGNMISESEFQPDISKDESV